jgi:hypothetical protein
VSACSGHEHAEATSNDHGRGAEATSNDHGRSAEATSKDHRRGAEATSKDHGGGRGGGEVEIGAVDTTSRGVGLGGCEREGEGREAPRSESRKRSSVDHDEEVFDFEREVDAAFDPSQVT